ncbi:MAG: DUF3473 domain-containing protein [Chloroflexota bacterium]
MNLFTIDLEDWFCLHNIPGFAGLDWDSCKLRLADPTRRLLEILKKREVKAIFFVLGYIADRAPDLIREIADEGHEIASHGYEHRLLFTQSEAEFEHDVSRSLESLARIGFTRVRGYRAPHFTMNERTPWGPPILSKLGFEYSSSLYPTNMNWEYGAKGDRREIFRYECGLLEIPLCAAKILNFLLPCSGGAYFRFAPYPFFKKLAEISSRQSNHYAFYIHPWELDPGQPRINTSLMGTVKHYYNLGATEIKLSQLIEDISFAKINIEKLC